MSTEYTTSQELFSHLFEACNILRGPINQDEYKSYVTPILFFKRLSDVYDEETQRALEESDGDEEYASFPENHSFIIPDGCHWNDVREVSENVGTAIVNAMYGIERANPDTLSGVFSSFDDANWTDKTKLNDERLKNLVEHMSAIRVGNDDYTADVMGDAYEYLIKKFADLSKKNAGEFYTPRTIVKLLVMLMDPKAGETVYDPACGTGGMLIEAIRHMNNDKLAYGKIYGQEKNLSTSAIARMNLFLHGGRDFTVTQGDTLRSPNYINGGQLQQFDCVIANPPFGLRNWGADSFETDMYGRNIWGCPSDSNADFAWLQHMIKSMNPATGRAAVVMPQGVLFHSSGKEGDIRFNLIKSDKIEYIISLVKGVFYGADVEACLIVLNNNKPEEHKNKVCFVDASSIYTSKIAQNIMTEENILEVYKLAMEYKDVDDLVRVATIDEIDQMGNILSVRTFVEKSEIERLDYKKTLDKYFELVTEVNTLEELLRSKLIEGGYLDV